MKKQLSEINFSKDLKQLSSVPKFNNTQKLDGIQHNPNEMKSTIFKQDYVVIIRKKLYYAISQEDEEQYTRVYQVNNFMSLNTRHDVYGTPGSCSVTIKGAERVVCAEQVQQDIQHWQTWQRMLSGWLNINDGDGNNSWTVGESDWALKDADGLDLKNMLKAREAKYGWKFAEKCDWEPMDEIYIFGKTRNKKLRDVNGMYPFKPIFFGYIDQVVKTYQAGQGQGLIIKISASDQLKLLNYSRVANAPAKMPGVVANGGYDISYNLPKDKWGNFILNDELYEDNGDNKTPYLYTNVFAGKPPYEIITQLALDAGIPKKYLDTRIEKITKVPFVQQITGQNIELLVANASSRLQFCKDAASKLFVEFFCDEEGNIVLKIPSYALGVNRLPANNMNQEIDKNIYDALYDPLKDIKDTATNSLTSTTSLTNTTSMGPIAQPNIVWKGDGVPLENYRSGRSGYTPIVIVDHYSAGTADSALGWFKNSNSAVSSQYIVTKKGEIWQVVRDEDTAYHAGGGNNPTAAIFPQLSGHVNSSTIGIEHEGFGELTTEQYNATLKLHNYLCKKWNIPRNRTYIIGHSEIDSVNKSDPGSNFPWSNLIRDLSNGTMATTKTTTTNLTNTTTTKFVQPIKVEKVIYPIKNNDTLESIALDFFNDKSMWNEIYSDNKQTIGNDPKIIQVGQKLVIYKRNKSDSSHNKTADQLRKQDVNSKLIQKLNNDPTKNNTMGSSSSMGKTLAEQTDQLIPEIQPEDIISFTMIDSDREIYNMYEVQLEAPLLDIRQLSFTAPQTVRRISSDFNSIARFGMRPAPGVISTPLINSQAEAEIFGIMLINTSMSKKITGTLNMIEDSAIKIGDPIRINTYDEHPYKETGLFPTYIGQSVFYVDAIERSINITNVSTMTLTLKAGRMMGQESVFDQMLLLYRYYFDEIPLTDFSSKEDIQTIKTQPYTIQESDTWSKILWSQYEINTTNIEQYMAIVQTIIKLNPKELGIATSYDSLSNKALVAGKVINIPAKTSSVVQLSNTTSSDFAYNWNGKYVDAAFLTKVLEVSSKLRMNPDDLMAVMAYESGISPIAVNAVSQATGLIQFLPETATGLGTTVAQLKTMSAVQQLDYVYKYLSEYAGKLSTIQDAYMAVLWPVAIGKPNSYVLWQSGSKEYNQNSQLDLNKKDGAVTKQEAAQAVIDNRDKNYTLK